MEKQEFLEKLRLALNGKVPADVVAENLQYYADYINVEIRKGRSEEEVMAALGDPRLIAKTIVETSGGKEGQGTEYGENDGGAEENMQGYGQLEGTRFRWLAKIPGWVWLILLLVIVVVILSVVFRALVFLAPALIVLGVVTYLLKIFKRE